MPTESDPITREIHARALAAAEKLAPLCHEAVRHLQGSFYVAAMDRLAELKEQIDYTRTVISILRDWQAANQKTSKDKPEAQPGTQEGST